MSSCFNVDILAISILKKKINWKPHHYLPKYFYYVLKDFKKNSPSIVQTRSAGGFEGEVSQVNVTGCCSATEEGPLNVTNAGASEIKNVKFSH